MPNKYKSVLLKNKWKDKEVSNVNVSITQVYLLYFGHHLELA
jgi:hypothetical protein